MRQIIRLITRPALIISFSHSHSVSSIYTLTNLPSADTASQVYSCNFAKNFAIAVNFRS